jgi:aspartyl-tRNA(Asn)/glutamyl-tRNA(Gln) amidotransferase subunit B
MAARFMADYGLSEYDATQLTQSKAVAAYFEETAKTSGQAKLACNWVTGELARKLNADDLDISSASVSSKVLGAIIRRIADGTISNSGGKKVFELLWLAEAFGEGVLPEEYVDRAIDEHGLRQMSDTGELEGIIDGVIAANTKSVEEYKAGNAKAFNALVGQAMKATKGKGNPAQVNELLKKKLD